MAIIEQRHDDEDEDQRFREEMKAIKWEFPKEALDCDSVFCVCDLGKGFNDGLYSGGYSMTLFR